MNKGNLLRLADLAETIPQKLFDMGVLIRNGDLRAHKCDSVGCLLGHATILDNIANIPIEEYELDFSGWAEKFFGIPIASDKWCYLFSGKWEFVDNTIKGTARRVRYVVKHGFPKNMNEQLDGKAPLSYNQ